MSTTARVAVVQHGDYREAMRVIFSGQPEPYFGMANSVRSLEQLLAGRDHLLISLDAPRYREKHGEGEIVGLPPPWMPPRTPNTLSALARAEQVCRLVRAFRPSHMLIRTTDVTAWRLLQYSAGRGLSTLVLFANFISDRSRRDRYLNPRLIHLLNQPNVFLVGNHRQPATQSLVDAGLHPAKAVSYEFAEITKRPENHGPKTLTAGQARTILYVGSVQESKGVGDLVDAIKLVTRRVPDVTVLIAGDGPGLADVRERAAGMPVRFLGRVSNEEAFKLMQASTLVCVPSRHDYPEGMPLVLTEALASRTPVVISDHPVFRATFRPDEGVRFFPQRDSTSLANAIQELLTDPDLYARTSDSTMDAFGRVTASTFMSDLLERWAATF